VLNNPQMKQRFFNSGVESVGTAPQEFTAVIKSETARLDQAIRKAGLRVQ
jgi:tripartite-type tricarboxylate transporter receptor subunit TctC